MPFFHPRLPPPPGEEGLGEKRRDEETEGEEAVHAVHEGGAVPVAPTPRPYAHEVARWKIRSLIQQ